MSKYALNIGEDNRILSACVCLPNATAVDESGEEIRVVKLEIVDGSKFYNGMPAVDTLPTGESDKEKDISNWLYVDGGYIYDPLPDPAEPEPGTSTEDILNALLGVESEE